MGMDLVRRRDSRKWSCNNALWIFIIDSAKSAGWVPLGTKNRLKETNDHDPQDYFSNNDQIVSPDDAEEMYIHLKKYAEENKPKEIEKEIIDSFLEWIPRRNEDNVIVDFPGFIIR